MAIDIDFDLDAFRKQQQQLKQVASRDIAKKVAEVKSLLKDIKELAELSGVTAEVRDLKYNIEEIEELHPDWNSSSYQC